MAYNQKFKEANYTKKIDRLAIALQYGHCTITQTDNEYGNTTRSLDLTDVNQVRDLHYALTCALREVDETVIHTHASL